MVTDVPGLAMVLPEEAERGGLGAVNVMLARHGIPLGATAKEGT
jgi:hypothetical protein